MLENVVNVKLFTIPNIIAIGSICFFWSAVAYALRGTAQQSSG